MILNLYPELCACDAIRGKTFNPELTAVCAYLTRAITMLLVLRSSSATPITTSILASRAAAHRREISGPGICNS